MKLSVVSVDSILTYARFVPEHADDYMHDAIVDHDPCFLNWLDVDRCRQGRFSEHTNGIDSLPQDWMVAS